MYKSKAQYPEKENYKYALGKDSSAESTKLNKA